MTPVYQVYVRGVGGWQEVDKGYYDSFEGRKQILLCETIDENIANHRRLSDCTETIREAILRGDPIAIGIAAGLASLAKDREKK